MNRFDPKPPISLCHALVLLALIALSSFPAAVLSDDARFYGTLRLPSDAADESSDPCGESLGRPNSCPLKCFRPDPVCGVDGITYWCGCADARCSGVKVAKLGFCEVGNGGSAPLSAQALLLVHIVWLIVLGFSVLFGLF